MNAKRKRSVRTSPARDEASEITTNWIKGADLRCRPKLVRRGRPSLANPKQLFSFRLPLDVIAGMANLPFASCDGTLIKGNIVHRLLTIVIVMGLSGCGEASITASKRRCLPRPLRP